MTAVRISKPTSQRFHVDDIFHAVLQCLILREKMAQVRVDPQVEFDQIRENAHTPQLVAKFQKKQKKKKTQQSSIHFLGSSVGGGIVFSDTLHQSDDFYEWDRLGQFGRPGLLSHAILLLWLKQTHSAL